MDPGPPSALLGPGNLYCLFPLSLALRLRHGRQENLIACPDEWKSFFCPPPPKDWGTPTLLPNRCQGPLTLTTHIHILPKAKKHWSYISTRRRRRCSNDTIYLTFYESGSGISTRPGHWFGSSSLGNNRKAEISERNWWVYLQGTALQLMLSF